MLWVTAAEFADRMRFERFVRVTNDAAVRTAAGTGTGTLNLFETVYYGGTVPTMYLDGVATAPATSNQLGTNGVWQVTFSAPPANGVLVTAEAPADPEARGARVDLLNKALVEAQKDVRDFLRSVNFQCPADEAVSVPAQLKGWAYIIAAYGLISDRGANLQGAYPDICSRYADLTGLGDAMNERPSGFQCRWAQLRKNPDALASDLTPIAPSASAVPFLGSYGSEDPYFDPPE